ncbi:MAG: THUMP domain-containing protein, partial [bacterium]|nr:THUMP domain-containing protein [bacterium]
MYEYQKTNRYFAQVAAGMEELGAVELKALGAQQVAPDFRGIYFEASRDVIYRINYCSRLISRVLAPLVKFHCHSPKYLYKKCREIRWDQFFSIDKTFAVFANVSRSQISHSQYAALNVKDAIVDHFREMTGERPNVERIEPDVAINLHIDSNFATVSWDVSGGALHRRGYRWQSVDAPMQETLAAAIIQLSGWN